MKFITALVLTHFFILSINAEAKSSSGNNILNRAILLNDVGAVQQTLQLRVDINTPDEDGVYAIHLAAAAKAKDKIMEILLKNGAMPNVQNSRGQTALEIAIRAHSLEKIKMLIAAGANPNLTNISGDSSLIVAVSESSIDPADMTELILSSNNVNINQKNNRGYTPLMLTVLRFKPSPGTVKSLINHGADKTIINLGRYIALSFAEGMRDYFRSQGPTRTQELSALEEIMNLLNK